MTLNTRYPIAKSTKLLCRMLGIPVSKVMRRAQLPPDFFENEGRGATGAQFFAIWEAVVQTANRTDLPLEIGKAFARGPFVPALFAFSCSPNIATGLKRLSVFKPLMGPMLFRIAETSDTIALTIVPSDSSLEIPDSLAAFEMVFFLEASRIFTVEPITPMSVGLPSSQIGNPELDCYFGVEAAAGQYPTLMLSYQDAHIPFVSENDELWMQFEPGLKRQLSERQGDAPMSLRVRNALLEMLPSGQSSIEAVCERLIMSRRSLQRRLKEEGQSFQSILDATRSDLSLFYLTKGEMSIEEISYLLAYRDPNSFYRAFHGWTGMTPAQVRGQSLH